MRKTVTALILAAALPSLALAMPGPDHRVGKPHHSPKHALDLSHEQRSKLMQLKGQSLKDQHALTKRYLEKLPQTERDALRAERQELRSQYALKFRELLNPEQRKTFDEQQKKREERRAQWQEFQTWKAEKAKQAQ